MFLKINDVQEGIVDWLQAQQPILDLVGDEIRESQWAGETFVYPALRVEIFPSRPIGDGTCRESSSQITFAVIAFAEGESSMECGSVIDTAHANVFGKQIVHSNWRGLRVDCILQGVVIRLAERIWRGENVYTMEVHH